MKKRILALALAGTTAFSMFGGLNVFALTEDGAYEGYQPTYLWSDGATTTVVSTVYGETVDTEINDMSKINFVTEMDFADIMEIEVDANDPTTVYLYDFFDKYIDGGSSVKAFTTAMDSDNAGAEIAKILGAGWVAMDTGRGEYKSIRADIIDAWAEFTDSITTNPNDYDYEDDGEDIYHFTNLLTAIETAEANPYAVRSSELVYLMQQYEYFVDGGLVTVEEQATDELDLIVEILEGRTADDFATAKYFERDWQDALEELDKLCAAATTSTKYTKALTYAQNLLYNYAHAAKADKSELTGLMDSLVVGGYYLYPWQDFKEGKSMTAEWKAYEYAYNFATVYLSENSLKTEAYQSDIDYITDMLSDALDALVPTKEAKPSKVLALEETLDEVSGLVETDYKAGWASYESAVAFAEKLIDGPAGETQTDNAIAILKIAKNGLTKKAVPLSLKKELRAAIKEADAWLADADDNYTTDKNAAQILAVMNAKANGVSVQDGADQLISKYEDAIAKIEAALDYSATVLGWSKDAAGKWTYGTADGYLANGWNKIGGTWYYFNADGTAKQGEWMQEDGTWYWFTSNCNAARGWAKVNGEWYFFNDGCKMMTGWVKVAGSWYYLAPSGKMVTGWAEVNGKWYYLSKEANAVGQMLYNTTVDGYKLGADGAWVK